MKLDVVKEILVKNKRVSAWTRGTITDIFYKNEHQD